MALTINPNTDTLWKVAYGREPTLSDKQNDIILEGESKNKAANDIISRHKNNILVGKVVLTVGCVLLALGIVLGSIYSSPAYANSITAFKTVQFAGFITALGFLFGGIGGYEWYEERKAFEEDKAKPLIEIIKRLGADLANIENREFENAFERQAIMTDWQILHDILMPYAKKA